MKFVSDLRGNDWKISILFSPFVSTVLAGSGNIWTQEGLHHGSSLFDWAARLGCHCRAGQVHVLQGHWCWHIPKGHIVPGSAELALQRDPVELWTLTMKLGFHPCEKYVLLFWSN